jgi:hypothetical protein
VDATLTVTDDDGASVTTPTTISSTVTIAGRQAA